MQNLDEILVAVDRLPPSALYRLRKHLDRLEKQVWKKELAKTTQEMKRRGVSDREIDAAVMRRRRENRR